MNLPRWVEVVEQFKDGFIKVVQVHHLQGQLHPIPCKDLIGTDVYPPTDKDGEFLYAFVSPVKVQVRVVTDTTNAKLQLLTVHFLMDGWNGESESQSLVELRLFRFKKFTRSFAKCGGNTSTDNMRHTDCRVIDCLTAEHSLRRFMHSVDKVLMGDGQLLISPSGNDTLAGQFLDGDFRSVGL